MLIRFLHKNYHIADVTNRTDKLYFSLNIDCVKILSLSISPSERVFFTAILSNVKYCPCVLSLSKDEMSFNLPTFTRMFQTSKIHLVETLS